MKANPLHSSELAAPPQADHYLPGAIQRAVFEAGIKHPATLYPIALGSAGIVVGWLFSFPLFYLAGFLGILGGMTWAVLQIFFRHETVGSRYIRRLNQRQKQYERHLRDLVQKELKACEEMADLRHYAAQGATQFKAIQEKYANVKELLEMKLHKEELTYGRFLGAAEQVSLSVLDNLKDIVGMLKSAGSIKTDYIQDRFNALTEPSAPSEAVSQEAAALKQRLAIRDRQLHEVNQLLIKNEEAMTEMEKISAAVAEWQIDGRFADTGFESAIARLQELAAQAHAYND